MVVINLLEVLGDTVKTEEVIEGMEKHDHDHADEDHDHEAEGHADEEHDHEAEDHAASDRITAVKKKACAKQYGKNGDYAAVSALLSRVVRAAAAGFACARTLRHQETAAA